jgi:hypothetical protein
MDIELNMPIPEDDVRKFLATNMILTDLEHYLKKEIMEWTNMAEAAPKDRGAETTKDALLDIQNELDRLKKAYTQPKP